MAKKKFTRYSSVQNFYYSYVKNYGQREYAILVINHTNTNKKR
jgi:hypothetical protein